MDWQKSAYLGGIVILSFILLFKWNQFQEEKENALYAEESSSTLESPVQVPDENSTSTVVVPEPTNQDLASELPTAPTENAETPVISNETSTPSNSLIKVSTDTLDILIDPVGGDIVKAVLPQHKIKLGKEQGFTILDRTNSVLYIAQSGLVGPNGTDKSSGRPVFNSKQSSYQLQEAADTLNVDLFLEQDGVKITKRFIFTRDSYLIDIHYLIDNQSGAEWRANIYGQIKRDNHQPPAAADSGFGVNPFVGAAVTTPEEKYKKIPLKDLEKKQDPFSIEGGWLAMVQHYFTSAWIPNADDNNKFELQKLNNQDVYLLRYIGPQTTISAGSQGEMTTRFYIGPKDIDRLEEIAENLDLTVDFGYLWWIAKPLFQFLDFLHGYIGNWGWSIIVLTIVIKAIFFYPSAISYRSMARMRKVAPKMQELKDRYGDDRQKMSQEMMKLYSKEKVNPMGGCLPMLIQMPVFIALYWTLIESVELRHAPFLLWIEDLSVMDPYFIFPLLMGATMFIQQKLNPTPPDPMQAKIMQWMPVAFTFMFLWFPAGLVIYWVTNNALSIIQQYIITRNIEAGDSK